MTITRKREHNYEKFIKPKRTKYKQDHKCIDCGKDSATHRCDECNTKRNAYAKEWRLKNTEHVRKKAKEWRLRNPDKTKYQNRRTQARQYDMSVEEYAEAMRSPCGICGSTTKRKSMDHCHKSNTVRGVLCFSCNSQLGWYEKNVVEIERWVGTSSNIDEGFK